ncbi:MAG: hypothetical protein Kow00109_25010 [Acidobacteriota bacterium]
MIAATAIANTEPVATLQVLDTGDAFAAERFGTCFLWTIPAAGSCRRILIDGPPGLSRLLRGLGLSGAEIGELVLTHIHPDHSAGAAILLILRRYAYGKKTILYTSDAVFQTLLEGFFPAFLDRFTPDLQTTVRDRPEDYVEFRPLQSGRIHELGDAARVEIRHNWHPVPTLGLKLHWRDGTVAISGDHCFRPDLLAQLRDQGVISSERHELLGGSWLWDAHLIYHEASPHGGPHTREEDLLTLPPDTQAKIRLVHLPDGYHPRHFPAAQPGETVHFLPSGGVRLDASPEAPAGSP